MPALRDPRHEAFAQAREKIDSVFKSLGEENGRSALPGPAAQRPSPPREAPDVAPSAPRQRPEGSPKSPRARQVRAHSRPRSAHARTLPPDDFPNPQPACITPP